MKMEAFVYCWTDHKTLKLYVGYHKGYVDDGYISSSKMLNKLYKERPHDFTRQIVAHGTAKDMVVLESKILKSVNAAKNDDYYNMNNQTIEFYQPTRHKIWRERIGKANKNKKRPDFAEYSRNRRGEKNHNYGKPSNTLGKKIYHNIFTGEQRFFVFGTEPVNWIKGYYDKDRNKGKNNPMYGRKRKK